MKELLKPGQVINVNKWNTGKIVKATIMRVHSQKGAMWNQDGITYEVTVLEDGKKWNTTYSVNDDGTTELGDTCSLFGI